MNTKVLLIAGICLLLCGCFSAMNLPEKQYHDTSQWRYANTIQAQLDDLANQIAEVDDQEQVKTLEKKQRVLEDNLAKINAVQPRVFRVAFDMDGLPFPHEQPSGIDIEWAAIPPFEQKDKSLYGLQTFYWGLSKFFRLGKVKREDNKQFVYPLKDSTFDPIFSTFASQIEDKLNRYNATNLVVVIHGFNTSIDNAKHSVFPEFYKAMDLDQIHKSVFLEIYWEGRVTHGIDVIGAFDFWNKTLTYSNLAGQIGLRNLLNFIGDKTNLDLFLLSHSRGASVALSAISEPVWDYTPSLCVPTIVFAANPNEDIMFDIPKRYDDPFCQAYFDDGSFVLHRRPLINEFKTTTVGMIAPALGGGHINQRLGEFYQNKSLRFVYSQQSGDFALDKGPLGGERKGGSDFGVSDSKYIEVLQAQPQIQAHGVVFRKGRYHGIEEYFADEEAKKAFMQLVGLSAENTKP